MLGSVCRVGFSLPRVVTGNPSIARPNFAGQVSFGCNETSFLKSVDEFCKINDFNSNKAQNLEALAHSVDPKNSAVKEKKAAIEKDQKLRSDIKDFLLEIFENEVGKGGGRVLG